MSVEVSDIVSSAPTDTDDLASTQDAAKPCPDNVPEKFWDASAGCVRTEALLRSYVELERHLGRTLPMPSEDDPASTDRLFSALGRPETPDDYEIDTSALGLEPDAELNARLFEAGFTRKQAALVYELAAEHLAPMMQDFATQAAAAQDQSRLEAHFGGPERWHELSTQLKQWGEKRFGPEALDAIASTFDGVVALHEMMRSSEPTMIGDSEQSFGPITREQLNAMVADPRYWRERDPQFIQRVSDGFAKLYAD